MVAKEIELHPGHWANTGSGANGILNEVTEARKVTKRVYDILRASNVPATYYEDNTSTNQRNNINTLVKHHNADRNGLIVSIHFNAGGNSLKPIGTEVLYYSEQALAAKIAKAISDVSGLKNRGAKKRTDLGVLANTYEPAILIEVCFVNSIVDAKIYRDNFEAICQAIAKELAAYLGKSLVTKQPSKVLGKQIINEEDTEMPYKFNATAKGDFAKLFKKAYEEGIFETDHSQKVASYNDEKIYNLYVSYKLRKELAAE